MLKSELKATSEKVQRMKDENKLKKAELDLKVKEINEKNKLIEAKIQSVQLKVRSITCPYPDDLVLRIFVSRLAEQVEARKLQVQ